MDFYLAIVLILLAGFVGYGMGKVTGWANRDEQLTQIVPEEEAEARRNEVKDNDQVEIMTEEEAEEEALETLREIHRQRERREREKKKH